VAYGDPRKLFYDDGTPIPIHKLGPDEAAMISAIEVDANGQTTRIRLWDKISALEKGMKHLGMFEKGRVQAQENLAIQVVSSIRRPGRRTRSSSKWRGTRTINVRPS